MVRVSAPTCSVSDVARAEAESFVFVVTNERLAGGVDDDDPAGLGEHLAAALVAFLPRAAEILHAARALRRGAGSDRGQGLGWPWRLRDRRGDRRRRRTMRQRPAAGRQRGLAARGGVRDCRGTGGCPGCPGGGGGAPAPVGRRPADPSWRRRGWRRRRPFCCCCCGCNCGCAPPGAVGGFGGAGGCVAAGRSRRRDMRRRRWWRWRRRHGQPEAPGVAPHGWAVAAARYEEAVAAPQGCGGGGGAI